MEQKYVWNFSEKSQEDRCYIQLRMQKCSCKMDKINLKITIINHFFQQKKIIKSNHKTRTKTLYYHQ
jgi:hypothetical protein